MAEYRFFGSESVLRGGLPLTKYGQRVALEPDEANALIAAHPPALLLPADLWDKCGITDEELAKFPSAEIHGAAPEEFLAKTKAVRMAWHIYREGFPHSLTETAADRAFVDNPDLGEPVR